MRFFFNLALNYILKRSFIRFLIRSASIPISRLKYLLLNFNKYNQRYFPACLTGPGFAMFFLVAIPVQAQNSLKISGLVLDGNSGQPIASARIIVKENRKATRTDTKGRFIIEIPKPGFYTFRVVHGTKIEQQRFEIKYDAQKIQILFGVVKQFKKEKPNDNSDSYTTTGNIQVFGKRDKTTLSRHRFSKDEIRRMPGAYGDSLSGVQTLPGVTRAPSVGVGPSSNIRFQNFVDLGGSTLGPPYNNSVGSGYLVIRGAGPRASKVFLDGMPVMYPYHLGDQSSVVNNDFIQSVDVYTGSFPVTYGHSTGGIISIEGPSEVKRNGGHINVSLFLTDVYYQRQLSNSTFAIATARKSYPNVAMLTLAPDAIPDNAQYADYGDTQFKMGWRLHPEHSLMYLAFGSRDILNYTKSLDELDGDTGGPFSALAFAQDPNNTNTNGRPPVGLDREFFTHGLRYDFSKRKMFQNRLITSVSYFQEDFEVRFDSPATGESIFDFFIVDGRRESTIKDELIFPIYMDKVTLNIGAEWTDYNWNIHLRDVTPRATNNSLTENVTDIIDLLLETSPAFRALHDGDQNKFATTAGWAQLELEFWRFRLVPGIRAEHWSLSGSKGIGPRMLAEFHLKEYGTTFQAGSGRHFSIPLEQNIISRQAGNPWLVMEESDHSVFGVEQKIAREWILKIEGFRNQFYNLVVDDRFIVNPWSIRTAPRELAEKLDDIISDPYENRYLGFSNDGTGFSNGVEVLIKKIRPRSDSGYFGWLSYTYSISKRNNHQPRLTDEEDRSFLSIKNNGRVVSYFESQAGPILLSDTAELNLYYDNDKEELYDFDRTHQISFVAGYSLSKSWQFGMRWIYQTNVPFTPIENHDDLGNAGGIQVYFPEYSNQFNSNRLHPYHQLDIRIDHFEHYGWGYANYFIELINVYARENPEEEQWNLQRPYQRGFNPKVSRNANYIKFGRDGPSLPLINVGLEIRF